MEVTEQATLRTSARISLDTQAALAKQRLHLSALAGRELSTDEVIQIMHGVFVRQPEAVIRQAVQP